MTTATIDNLVTDAQLSKYAKLIYDYTGNRISPRKKALLSNRLRRRLRATGIEDFEAYYAHLKNTPVENEEWDRFLQEITTHETFLYRDEAHWKWFTDQYLPDIVSAARQGRRQKSLRIWSAACSTGDEAYTIAACIADSVPNYSQWSIRIVGTDVGVNALKQARQATFNERAMRLLPDDLRRRYFTELPGEKNWRAKPALIEMIRFKRHNLLDAISEPPFDLVVLKNVLIYFDAASKRAVVDNLCNVMKRDALLLAGPAEGVFDLLQGFQRIEPWLYRKL